MFADHLYRWRHSTHDVLEKNGISLFGGSAWWALPDDMALYALEQENDLNKSPLRFIKSVMVPDENYYQTVLMNSKFSNRIYVNPDDMVAQNCQTFAYFNPKGKPFIGHPYTFKKEDASLLKDLSINHLFARIFNMDVDSEILNWIDHEHI